MMPPLPVIVLVLLLLAASGSATGFTCTCQSAIGYIVPNATTYEELVSRFSPATTLHDLLAANQLPPDTAARQAIPARTTLSIPFTCRCVGDAVGRSDLYTKLDDGLVEMATTANLIYAAGPKLWTPLPCSCDEVDGSDVMHFAHIVRAGDSTLELAAKYRVPESTLLRVNNITNHTSLLQGQILDIPLQRMVREQLSSMGTWSRVHYISQYRQRRLLEIPVNPTAVQDAANGVNAVRSSPTVRSVVATLVGVFSGVGGLILVAIILSLLYGTWYYWKSAVISLSSRTTTNGTMQFNYSDLVHATDRFSDTSKIGEGAFGAVYKASCKGQELAVKKMTATNGNTEDFHDELQTISNTRHTNLVRLKGWSGRPRLIDATSCWKIQITADLLLVFELIPNGNLEDHLYKRERVLPWEKRYKVVKGVGSALRYLHHECNPCILHRDIKPGNILLDHHFNAKLGDFGLSLITSKNRATAVALSMGSRGYMDPQLEKHGQVEYSRKSDVYSFGILLLEIACIVAVENPGKNKRENPWRKSREEIWELYNGGAEPQVEAAADAKLCGVFDRNQMKCVVLLGLECSHPQETQRPSMEDAMKFLELNCQE